MANVTQIIVEIRTGNRSGAGTDGDVYLGIGGREFYIDSNDNDFERNDHQTFVIGESKPGDLILNAAHNDPRVEYIMTDRDIKDFPIYIRYEPGTDWNLEMVKVTVRDHDKHLATFGNLAGKRHLWLGSTCGKYCYLRSIEAS